MRILALELSSARGSIACTESGREPFLCEFPNDRKHSGVFFEQLQLCSQRFGSPDQIIVGLGPGSYAGTRIAIAAAIGLQAATGARLLGVPSVCGISTEEAEYTVIGDARRHAFYFARVRNRSCIEGPLLCARPELEQLLQDAGCPVFATESLAAAPHVQIAYPSALVLAQIDSQSFSPEPLEPIYLREPHITFPKPVTLPLPT